MDGKIMGFTPPDKFTFDLQRFTLSETETTSGNDKSVFSAKIGDKTYYGTKADFKSGDVEVGTEKVNLSNATEIKLLDNFEVNNASAPTDSAPPTPALTLSKNCEFDLNGKTLTFGDKTPIGIQIADGTVDNTDPENPTVTKTTFTLKDSSTDGTGKIVSTWNHNVKTTFAAKTKTTELDYMKANRVYAAINVGTARTGGRGTNEITFDGNNGYAQLIMQGGTIESKGAAICASDYSDVSITNGCTVTSSESCAVYFGDKGYGGGTLNMTGGKLQSSGNLPTVQVSGNYSTKVITGKEITLNISGGEVIYDAGTGEDSTLIKSGEYFSGNIVAIYVGGNGKLTISDNAKVKSTGTGVEMRAGGLEVKGGTITSTAEKYTVRPNKSGSTTFGAAIAVSQHTTGQNINVKVEGENTKVSAPVALTVENPQDNEDNDTAPQIEVKQATFISTAPGEAAIAAKAADSRSTIKITGDTTFVGDLESTFTETTQGKATGIQIAQDATVTVAKLVVDEEGNVQTEADGTPKVDTTNPTTFTSSSLTFTETWEETVSGKKEDKSLTYYVEEGWNKSKAPIRPNTIFFLEKTSTTTTNTDSRVTLEPATDVTTSSPSTTDLELKIASNGLYATNQVLTLDMTDTVFGGLSSAFKKLTASQTSPAADKLVSLNIKGNANLNEITGGAGNDTLTAVAEDGVTLDGGAGNDSLVGGDGEDTFVYSAGKDTIENYTYSTDKISVTGSENPPTSFNNVTFNGSNFVISLGSADNVLNVNGVSNVALLHTADNVTSTYTYKGHSGGGMDYIAQEGVGISLGSGYTTKNYNGRNRNYQTIDASNVTVTTGIELRANDEDSKLIGASMGGALYGGDGKDYIKSSLQQSATAASIKATLDGGSDGDDTLEGTGNGIETFVYRGGNDSISGYNAANGDLISIRGFNPGEATISKDADNNKDFILTFDAGTNVLSIAGGASVAGTTEDPAISIQSGNRLYTYTKDYVAYNKGITLASDYSKDTFNGAGEGYTDYVTINAAAVTLPAGISVVGNANSNYIVGSSLASADAGDTLAGGKGNDRIDVNERGDDSKYVFEYTEGKDEVFGFNQTNDKLKITAANIKSAKTGNNKLTLTVKKNSDVLTLRGDDDITKVNLQDSGDADYLTKDGYVKNDTKTLKLFESAKGRIELGDDPYKTSNINAVDAKSVEKQSVTLVGGTQGGTFTYATGNKKRDGFVYGGGQVTIEGYEESKDRIDLNGSTFTSFTVESGNVNLLLNNKGTDQYISVAGAANKEVLLRDGSSRSFKKMVFVQSGILQNKAKNPTMVTVSAGTGETKSYTVADSVKKVFVTEDIDNSISIKAGSKNNTIIDASKAGFGVSLSGGKKNDKLIGNTANADTFIYSEGKDIIQGYTSTDNISITDSLANSLESAKITAGSKSIKFKFSNKNTLTVKANKGESLSGALNINNLGQTYAKNAIAKGGLVTLTSAFSGTFKTDDKKLAKAATEVNGSAVSKNLTFKGTADGETLSGGSKKNTFKGGGGNDSLYGGTGAKDIFFYAKGDKGETTIANFEFGANKDRLKIASGTIGEISKLDDGKTIQFAMNSGKKGDTSNIGWFKVETTKATKDIAIKANNTYYWFADKDETIGSGDDTLTINSGQLITSDTRVSASDVSGYDIIDLNYSTNLAKSGVAVKVTSKPTAKSNS